MDITPQLSDRTSQISNRSSASIWLEIVGLLLAFIQIDKCQFLCGNESMHSFLWYDHFLNEGLSVWQGVQTVQWIKWTILVWCIYDLTPKTF